MNAYASRTETPIFEEDPPYRVLSMDGGGIYGLFTALMLREPTIALHMIKLLCQRVRRSSRQVEEAAFLTLRQRLALLLESLLDEHSAAGNDPSPDVIKISQSELASFLNVTRQVGNES